MQKYYTQVDVVKGIEGLPSISETTLRNLRQQKKLKYTKLGNKCLYTKEWIEEYLNKNIVDIKTA